ncbi:uncharacterized protein dlk2 [Aulostomus maculatus]
MFHLLQQLAATTAIAKAAVASMFPLRAITATLLLLLLPPCTGSNCSCDVINGRCDESAVCRCDPGWDGERCERCVPTPGCLHGWCQQPWQCRCHDGWGGRFCDKDLQACSQQAPCQNGATCMMENSGEFTCLCPEGFHGRNCHLKTGPCQQRRSPCKNGGLCEDANGFATELTCRCLAGFTGSHCEIDIDDCQMKPCANGATCLDAINRFSCLCPTGFTGRFCTVNLDDCASRPCLNSGRCLDLAAGFYCVCRPGFTGATCESPLIRSDTRGPGWSMLGWEEGEATHHMTTDSKNLMSATRINSSHHGNRLLKVTVREHGSTNLSKIQFITLLVLAVMTLSVVALTSALILQGYCRYCGHTPCELPLLTSQLNALQDGGECHVTFLNTGQSEKKKLNIEVV